MIPRATPWASVVSGARGFSCEPCRKGDVSAFYWKADFKTTEIIEAFSLAIHTSQIAELAGPARLAGCDCTRCGSPIYVFSRTDAANRVRAMDGDKSNTLADWASPTICRECRTYLYDKRHEALREEWRRREDRARSLRYMPYAEYLKTPEWRSRAEAAKRSAGFKCQTCSSSHDLHTHHRTYVRRGDERARDLIVLCAECHKVFHENRRLAESGRAA